MIPHEPRARLRNRQPPWAAELGDKLDTHPLLAAVASERVAACTCSSQREDGSGTMMAKGLTMYGDDGADDFEGVLPDDALSRELG